MQDISECNVWSDKHVEKKEFNYRKYFCQSTNATKKENSFIMLSFSFLCVPFLFTCASLYSIFSHFCPLCLHSHKIYVLRTNSFSKATFPLYLLFIPFFVLNRQMDQILPGNMRFESIYKKQSERNAKIEVFVDPQKSKSRPFHRN